MTRSISRGRTSRCRKEMGLINAGRSWRVHEKGQDSEYYFRDDALLVNGGTISPWLKERQVLSLVKEG